MEGVQRIRKGILEQVAKTESGALEYQPVKNPPLRIKKRDGTVYQISEAKDGNYYYYPIEPSKINWSDRSVFRLAGSADNRYYAKASDTGSLTRSLADNRRNLSRGNNEPTRRTRGSNGQNLQEENNDGSPGHQPEHGQRPDRSTPRNQPRSTDRQINYDYRHATDLLNRIGEKTLDREFVRQADDALDAQISNWRNKLPDNPAEQLLKIVDDKNLQLNDRQKEFLRSLIRVRTLRPDDSYGLLDPRYQDSMAEPYRSNQQHFRAIAETHIGWLRDKDARLLDLLTNRKGERPFSQVSERRALSVIENTRESILRGDNSGAAARVASFLYLLTKEQRQQLATNLAEALPKFDRKDRDYETAAAFATGLYYFIRRTGGDTSALAKLISNDVGVQNAMNEQLSQRSKDVATLHQVTNEFVKLNDQGEYVLDEDKRKAFEQEMAKHNPESLIAFALGLKGTPHEAFGERLLLGLSLKDSKGNRVLPTASTSFPDPSKKQTDELLGGIFFGADGNEGAISQKKLSKTLDSWNQDAGGPRAQRHAYQALNSANDLIPEKGARQIWYSDGDGRLASQRLSKGSDGRLSNNSQIGLNNAPRHAFGSVMRDPVTTSELTQRTPIQDIAFNTGRELGGLLAGSPASKAFHLPLFRDGAGRGGADPYPGGGKVLNDILRYGAGKLGSLVSRFYNDVTTLGHEATHFLDRGGPDSGKRSIYLGKGVHVVLTEPPNMTQETVAREVPRHMRHSRLDMYLLPSGTSGRYWSKQALQLFDEMACYIANAKIGVEIYPKVARHIREQGCSGIGEVQGALEYVPYALAAAKVVEERYSTSQYPQKQQFIDTARLLIEEAMNVAKAGMTKRAFAGFDQGRMLRDLRGPSSLKTWAIEHFGADWYQKHIMSNSLTGDPTDLVVDRVIRASKK